MPTWAAIRIYIQIVAMIGAFGGGFYFEHLRWAASIEKTAVAAVKTTQEQGQVSVNAAVGDAQKQAAIATTTVTVVRRFNVASLSAPVTCAAIRLLDGAAGFDPTADCAGKPDAALSPFSLGVVLGSVANNYGAVCRANAAQLDDLSGWLASENKVQAK